MTSNASASSSRAPTTCACCGGSRLAKIGEDVTKTLEEIPRRFKLIETVREKFTCRDCEKVSQPPAPFHATPRGFIGPRLLATILFDKFGMHMPLNRQSARFKCEGVELTGSGRIRICGSAPPLLVSAVLKVEGAAMIPIPSGVRVWLATSHTDMRSASIPGQQFVQTGCGKILNEHAIHRLAEGACGVIGTTEFAG
jgi:transposase